MLQGIWLDENQHGFTPCMNPFRPLRSRAEQASQNGPKWLRNDGRALSPAPSLLRRSSPLLAVPGPSADPRPRRARANRSSCKGTPASRQKCFRTTKLHMHNSHMHNSLEIATRCTHTFIHVHSIYSSSTRHRRNCSGRSWCNLQPFHSSAGETTAQACAASLKTALLDNFFGAREAALLTIGEAERSPERPRRHREQRSRSACGLATCRERPGGPGPG